MTHWIGSSNWDLAKHQLAKDRLKRIPFDRIGIFADYSGRSEGDWVINGLNEAECTDLVATVREDYPQALIEIELLRGRLETLTRYTKTLVDAVDMTKCAEAFRNLEAYVQLFVKDKP